MAGFSVLNPSPFSHFPYKADTSLFPLKGNKTLTNTHIYSYVTGFPPENLEEHS